MKFAWIAPACLVFAAACFVGGCGKNTTPASTSNAASNPKLTLTLDWKPEPEFGGFYAAQQNGAFKKHGLDIDIASAGEGAPTWQLVATGKTDFATTAADQVLIARNSGADILAFFTVYQTFPQGIMVHKSRNFSTIQDVFTHDGVLLAEDNSWLHFLMNKYPNPKVKIIPYGGGITDFLARTNYSQQCFITSEPILARDAGSDPQTFMIADEGFNPYTTVVICRGETWRNDPARVKAMAAACRQGWRAYLDNPAPANIVMGNLNKDMDALTFAAAAAAQMPLIETPESKTIGLGCMTADRWNVLAKQLVDLKVIKTAPKAQDCFVNP